MLMSTIFVIFSTLNMSNNSSHGLAEKIPIVAYEKCNISYLANESDKLGNVLGVDFLCNYNVVMLCIIRITRIINILRLLIINISFYQFDYESLAQVIVKHLNSQDLQNVERLYEVWSKKRILPNHVT